MGILSRIFNRQAPAEGVSSVGQVVEAVCRFSDAVANDFGKEAFESDGLERQVLYAYVFGAVTALAVREELTPPQAHAVMLSVLKNHYGCSAGESAATAQALINAMNAGPEDTLYAIIHRGADAFIAREADPGRPASRDFASVVSALRTHTPETQEGS